MGNISTVLIGLLLLSGTFIQGIVVLPTSISISLFLSKRIGNQNGILSIVKKLETSDTHF